LAVGSWQLAVGSWQLAVGSETQLAVVSRQKNIEMQVERAGCAEVFSCQLTRKNKLLITAY